MELNSIAARRQKNREMAQKVYARQAVAYKPIDFDSLKPVWEETEEELAEFEALEARYAHWDDEPSWNM